MVTGATFNKEHFFKQPEDLTLLHDLLLELAEQYEWRLEAWAILANHYHFIAHSPACAKSLGKFVTHFHGSSARKLNLLHKTPGRKVWYQYWDTRITFQPSYLARLNYVMQNPVKHKIIDSANDYEWCSANWFEKNANPTHYKSVISLKTDSVSVVDDF